MNNFTCFILGHNAKWSLEAMCSFAPVYPTSIRGTNDQRGVSGHR